MPNKASGSGVEEHVKTTALVSFAGGEGTENNQNSILDLLMRHPGFHPASIEASMRMLLGALEFAEAGYISGGAVAKPGI